MSSCITDSFDLAPFNVIKGFKHIKSLSDSADAWLCIGNSSIDSKRINLSSATEWWLMSSFDPTGRLYIQAVASSFSYTAAARLTSITSKIRILTWIGYGRCSRPLCPPLLRKTQAKRLSVLWLASEAMAVRYYLTFDNRRSETGLEPHTHHGLLQFWLQSRSAEGGINCRPPIALRDRGFITANCLCYVVWGQRALDLVHPTNHTH